ncbi:hypothetical protein CONCODRAFT_170483 [Conidiobolus coronatus NRRL 28638]|uniref:F-box domain-containing protein n=1 Tax=Conidiobolus coronatus (strain ATCC 28846 / CBS 209.66 / NRRL 28638) TaxID=796925 RepID=A0A137P6U1_CONC2|nr:hypothetical protein CONCODRAFT_170483 [Conidiobolus coronatus NRRL 28638]|eukprot:KXN70654.1 hypothetical protein CONCODRAFT_170483 [Conidiobolus coronatus NRRL 28638]
MEKLNINKTKWELVFINNDEFKNYLNRCDFIQLSKLSKITRLKLKSKVFEEIYISKWYKKLIIEELSKCYDIRDWHNVNSSDLSIYDHIKSFNLQIHEIKPYIKSINIMSLSNHFHLSEISSLFSQLTSLYIYDAKISLTAFINALNSLKALQNLKIITVSFIQYRNETYPIIPIKLPITLKSIHWTNNTVSLCDLEEEPLTINFGYGRTLSGRIKFLFQHDNYPNLKKFSSILLPTLFNSKILSNNPNLNCLDLKINVLSETEVSMIQLAQNIKKLELGIDSLNLNLSGITLNFPCLNSIYLFKVDNRIWPFLEKLTLSSPNLSELKIEFHSDKLLPVINLANNLGYLQKLIIDSKCPINLNFNNFNPSPTLKHLEILFMQDIYRHLPKLSQSHTLKVVSFRKGAYNNIYLSTLNQENTPKPWKLAIVGESIKCYNI